MSLSAVKTDAFVQYEKRQHGRDSELSLGKALLFFFSDFDDYLQVFSEGGPGILRLRNLQ